MRDYREWIGERVNERDPVFKTLEVGSRSECHGAGEARRKRYFTDITTALIFRALRWRALHMRNTAMFYFAFIRSNVFHEDEWP